MDTLYISKKELLERYGISYGALYRWKRMGLIPEDWFIRRSTPTGQETFFRREQILPRMEMILARGASLEELASELNAPKQAPPKPVLILRDRYTTHRFPLEELESACILLGSEKREILKSLKGVFSHE